MSRSIFAQFLIFLVITYSCFSSENINHSSRNADNSTEEQYLYSAAANRNFIVDPDNSNDKYLRICVPVAYPQWFSVPTSCIDKVEITDEKNIDDQKLSFARIQFKSEYSGLNSILPSFQELIYEENSKDEKALNKRWGWRPPWTWSSCAKCKFEVNFFITTSILAAATAAGATGPGALAVCEALIVGKYGLAAWKAIEASVFSLGVGEICKKICTAQGKCR